MALPTLPTTHRWVYGELALSLSNGALIPAPDTTGTVYSDFTGVNAVTNLYDSNGQPTNVARIVGGVVQPVGVPTSVTAVFVGFGSGVFPLNQNEDIAAALAASASSSALSASVSAASVNAASALSRTDAIDSQRAASGIARLVYANGSYPARPSLVKYAEYVGPADPGTSAIDGDTWIDTSAASAA